MRMAHLFAFLLAGLAFASAGTTGAQEPEAKSFAYEVVAVTLKNSGSGNMSIDSNNNSYVATNVGLKSMIQDAYDLQIEQQLTGLPNWAKSAHYDIKAKMDADNAARLKALPPKELKKAENQMLQALLAERFGLKMHHETRELPIYALVQTKGGSKLKAADATSAEAGNMSVNNQKMEAYSADMQRLSYFLSYQAHRPLVDKTGLTGKYDTTLEWTRDDLNNSTADGTKDRAPGLFTAIREQCGLKLKSTKGPVDTIMIDHLEAPGDN